MRYLKETFFENLLRAYGRKGGNIYQFFPSIAGQSFVDMEKSWQEYVLCGLEFNTPEAFEKLAKMYQVKMEVI